MSFVMRFPSNDRSFRDIVTKIVPNDKILYSPVLSNPTKKYEIEEPLICPRICPLPLPPGSCLDLLLELQLLPLGYGAHVVQPAASMWPHPTPVEKLKTSCFNLKPRDHKLGRSRKSFIPSITMTRWLFTTICPCIMALLMLIHLGSPEQCHLPNGKPNKNNWGEKCAKLQCSKATGVVGDGTTSRESGSEDIPLPGGVR